MRILDTSREKYNNRKKTPGCVFCNKKVTSVQECTVFSYKHWHVLVNKHPYMNGNLMLVPKKHRLRLSALSTEEWTEFPLVLEEVQKVLGDKFKTKSFNIGLNEGKDSGASVPHIHWQVIPRKRKNHTVVGTLADIEVITLASEELKKQLSK